MSERAAVATPRRATNDPEFAAMRPQDAISLLVVKAHLVARRCQQRSIEATIAHDDAAELGWSHASGGRHRYVEGSGRMTDEAMLEVPLARLQELTAQIRDLIAERDAATAAIVRLREALEWYAEPQVWQPCEHGRQSTGLLGSEKSSDGMG